MARPLSPLTKLILSFPFDTPAAKVIAAAKSKGMKTSDKNVYKVRSAHRARGKAAAAKSTATPAAPAKRAAAPAGGKMSPTELIRSMPNATPAEIRAAAAAKGIKFSKNLIYVVRSSHGKKPTASPAPRASVSTPSDQAFRKLVLDLGVARAEAIVADVRDKLAAIIG